MTLGDGSQWLIHKGGGYGISSDTVVVDARHMSSDWTVSLHVNVHVSSQDEGSDASDLLFLSSQVVKEGNFQGRKSVTDFVATGGSDYNFLFDNCHRASIRMMNQ